MDNVKQYRKKPVVIDAMQYDGSNYYELRDWTNQPLPATKKNGQFILKTLEGEHIASLGDYIIKGIAGEFYPCKPDIFDKTYEEVT